MLTFPTFQILRTASADPPLTFAARTSDPPPAPRDQLNLTLRPTWVANMDPPFPGLNFPTVQQNINALYEELFDYVREGFVKLHANQPLEAIYPELKGMDSRTADTVFLAALCSQNFGESIPLSRSDARRFLPYAEKYPKQMDQIGQKLAESGDVNRLFNYAIVRFLTHPNREIVSCPADGNDLLKKFFVTVSPNQFMVNSKIFSNPKRNASALTNTEAMFPFHDFAHWVAVSTSFKALKNEAPMAVHLYEKHFENMSGIREHFLNPKSHDFQFEEIANSLYFIHNRESISNAEFAFLISNDLVNYLLGINSVKGYHLNTTHQLNNKITPNDLAILAMFSTGELPASQIEPSLSMRAQDPDTPKHRYLKDTFGDKPATERIRLIATEYQNKLDHHEKRPFIKDWARHLAYIRLAETMAQDPELSEDDRRFVGQIKDWLLFNDLHRDGKRIPLLKLTMDRMGVLEKMTPEERTEFEKLATRNFQPIQVTG